MVPFAVAARPIIDGGPDGFCKLIVDRGTHRMLGCHIVGERAVEIAQVAAVAIAAAMPVEQFVRIPISFPTYTNVLERAAIDAAGNPQVAGFWDAPEPATPANDSRLRLRAQDDADHLLELLGMDIARDLGLVVHLEIGGQLPPMTDCVVDEFETRG